jgi:hypothetical protein
MLRIAMTLYILLFFGSASQSAVIEFRGTLIVSSVTQACVTNGITDSGDSYRMRYSPRLLGTNGSSTSLTAVWGFGAVNYTLSRGNLVGNIFVDVNMTGVARKAFRSIRQMRITSQSPANLTSTTANVSLSGDIKGFLSDPLCDIHFSASGAKQ